MYNDLVVSVTNANAKFYAWNCLYILLLYLVILVIKYVSLDILRTRSKVLSKHIKGKGLII